MTGKAPQGQQAIASIGIVIALFVAQAAPVNGAEMERSSAARPASILYAISNSFLL